MAKRVLFVCTGNTCRSPMALGLLLKMAPHLDLETRSAGTSASTGAPASSVAIEAMREVGVDITDHRSSMLNGYMLEEADVVFCMAERHRRHIVDWFKSMDDKVYLMREFDPERTDPDYPDVPDPIGLEIDTYRRVLTMLERSMHEAIKIL
jgi:protein-tyrosine-phosphatase